MSRYIARYRTSARNGHVRLVRRTQAHEPHQLRAYDQPLHIGEPPLKPTPWFHVLGAIVVIIAVALVATCGQP